MRRSAPFVLMLILTGGGAHGQGAAPAAAPAAAPQTSVAAFGRLPTMSHVTLSPNGALLAAGVSTDTRMVVVVREAVGGKTIKRIKLGPLKLRGVQWIDDDRLIFTYSKTTAIEGMVYVRDEYFMAAEVNLKTGKYSGVLGDLPRNESERLNILTGTPRSIPDKGGGRALVVSGESFFNNQGVLTLYTWKDDHASTLRQGDANTVEFALSPNGAVVGRVDYESKSGRWRVYAGPEAFHLNLVKSGVDLVNYPSFVGATADGSALYMSDGESFERRYSQVNLATGAISDAPDWFTGADLIVDDYTGVVIGAEMSGLEETTYRFVDPSDDALWRGAVKAFKGAAVTLVSLSADHQSMVVRTLGGEWGYSYALVRRKTGTADFLFDVYDGIGPNDVSPRTVISYPAADGLEIKAYLTTPRESAKGPRALVVLPHGGPFARDDSGFDWWSQALASQGYIVLQPQFRGSAGFGEALLKAGYGEYGKKMQTDLSDGVAALVKQGLVDPKRVAIAGASYGGYAALAGVTLQRGVYRCAVAVAGPANMRRQLEFHVEQNYGSSATIGTRYWLQYLGITSRSDPKLDAISPEMFAAADESPVLLIHGLDDTVVPYDQSTRMEAALRKAGKSVRLETLKAEDHHLSRAETRLQMLTATVDFLKSCNPAGRS